MATQAACRVCAGELSLRLSGNGHTLAAHAFAPSLHVPGRHGDLLECVECGTVQQVLPSGDELHDLYRDVDDEAYLAEETGRRATAAHLLDLIGEHVGTGRLLDVGCGHGLLLDEARRRGFEVVGLELSRAAARHARDVLGLDVRELLAARGLVISTDVPLVRSFSARRWAEGLAERLGPARAPLEALAARLPDRASLSLALYDERVVIAQRIEVQRALEPLVRDRGADAKVVLVLPAYEATRTIPAVVEEIPVAAADRALLVDDASGDETPRVALEHG